MKQLLLALVLLIGASVYACALGVHVLARTEHAVDEGRRDVALRNLKVTDAVGFNVDHVELEFDGDWFEVYDGPAGIVYRPGEDASVLADFSSGVLMRVIPTQSHRLRHNGVVWSLHPLDRMGFLKEGGQAEGGDTQVCDYFCGDWAYYSTDGDCWETIWIPPQYEEYAQCSAEGEDGCEVEIWCADNAPIGDPYDEVTFTEPCESDLEFRESIYGWLCVIF
jgi:hypothetical protein